MPADTRDPMEIAEERIAEAKRTGARKLALSNLHLTELPPSLAELTHLGELVLMVNRLTQLPDWLCGLTQLREFDLHGNQLTELPDFFPRLSELQTLYLSSNKFGTVPECLLGLKQLRVLDLSSNTLSALPPSLTRLDGLQSLYLHENPKLGLPPELLGPRWPHNLEQQPKKPASEILDYYFRVVRGFRPLNEAKVILVGRGEVGKTSLVKRLVHDQFTLGESITHGISITKYPIDLSGDAITLHLWDFGGQEIMHGTHQFFLTERSLYLLVLNGRGGSIEQEAEYWMQLIRSYGGDSPVLVVLNKQGQHPFDVDRDELAKRFPQIAVFVRTDCADNLGIDELRKAIARVANSLPNLRAKFPKAWFAIKDRLSGMAENYIGYEKFGTLCDELGEKDPGGQESLAAVLHVLGIALCYRDDPRL